MNGVSLQDRTHPGLPNGMKLSILFFVLAIVTTPLIRLKDDYSASSSPLLLKMSLKPYMKDLQRDLDEEGIATLLKKEKDVEGFSELLDLLQTFVHPSWPLCGLDDIRYNFDCSPPYSNFLNLNSSSRFLYVPYHTCYDDVKIGRAHV